MIHLGFELRTGRPIAVPIGHLAICGQTQSSGKTTSLEGLVTRSNCRAVAFVTKRGEGSFRVASPIPPYFTERTDWPFIRSILEATAGEKLKFERAQIMNLCEDYDGPEGHWGRPLTLDDVLTNTTIALSSKKCTGFGRSVYTVLNRYLRDVVPEVKRLPYTSTLELSDGLNVMDLCEYSFPLQSLVVRSVIEWIHRKGRRTICVIPEAWKFAPRQRQTPVRLATEEFIRQGAAIGNFVWIDSQDFDISPVLLGQVKVWLFGVQRDPKKIERTLAYIPADLQKPNQRDIATLGIGQFIVCFERSMYRVQVQPAWLSSAHCEAIARGEEPIESAKQVLREFDEETANG